MELNTLSHKPDFTRWYAEDDLSTEDFRTNRIKSSLYTDKRDCIYSLFTTLLLTINNNLYIDVIMSNCIVRVASVMSLVVTRIN